MNEDTNSLAIIEAWEHIQSGSLNEAIELLKGELTTNINSRVILYAIGFAYKGLGNFGLAENYYLKALASQEDAHLSFPNLKGYDFLTATDDIVYCHLGIVYQLKQEYQKAIDAFKKAIEINAEYLNTYNSMAITYRTMGDLKSALETYDAGINMHFKYIHRCMVNSIDNEPVGFIGYNSKELWIKVALDVMLYFTVKDNIDHLSWPTSEQAEQYYRSNEHGGLLFIDLFDIKNKKVRSMLPNYLDTFYIKLKSNIGYSLFLTNKARILADLGKVNEARQLLNEAIEFIPRDSDFKDPFIAIESLKNLDNPEKR